MSSSPIICELPDRLIPEAIKLIQDELGIGDKVAERVKTLKPLCAISPVGDLMAVCTTEVLKDASAVRTALSEADETTAALVSRLLQFPAGLFRTGAVARAYRGTGVSDAILNRIDQDWSAAGVKSRLATAWERSDNGAVPSAHVLERRGLHAAMRIPEFWRRDSIERGYTCTSCQGVCRCAAIVFVS
jgi:hypothetical protein